MPDRKPGRKPDREPDRVPGRVLCVLSDREPNGVPTMRGLAGDVLLAIDDVDAAGDERGGDGAATEVIDGLAGGGVGC